MVADLFSSSRGKNVLSNYIGRQKLEHIPAKHIVDFDEFHHEVIFKISSALGGRALKEGPSFLFCTTILFNMIFLCRRKDPYQSLVMLAGA